MSEMKPMTEAEKNLRECQEQLDMDGVMVGVSRQALEETLTELDASRAREARLVEALRVAERAVDDCLTYRSHLNHAARDTIRAALSLYDTPAEMPGDCHPQGD